MHGGGPKFTINQNNHILSGYPGKLRIYRDEFVDECCNSLRLHYRFEKIIRLPKSAMYTKFQDHISNQAVYFCAVLKPGIRSSDYKS